MTGATIVLLPLAFVALLLGRVYAPRAAQRPSPAMPANALPRAIIAGIALYQSLVVLVGLTLGRLELLWPRYIAGALATLAVVAVALARRPAPGRRLWSRLLRTRRGWLLVGLCAAAALVAAPWVLFDALLGTSHADGLIYHVPRVQHWIAQGSFAPWPTPVWQQVGLPVAADLYLGLKVLLGGGWQGAAANAALLTLGAALCVFVSGRDLGLSMWRAGCAAALFVTFPAVGQRAGAWSSDIAAAFPLMAGFALWQARRVSVSTRWPPLATFVLLAGVGIASKATALSMALLLFGVGLWRQRRARVAASAARLEVGSGPGERKATKLAHGAIVASSALAAVAMVLASYAPVQRLFGDLLGGGHGRGLSNRGRGMSGVLDSLVFNLLQWALEPLAYIPRGLRDALMAPSGLGLGRVFPLLGISDSPAHYPSGNPDMTRTGVLPLLLAPLVAARLPRQATLQSLSLLVASFVALYAPLRVQVHGARFGVLLLAGYALMWAAPVEFDRGRGRWLLAGIVALSAAATLLTSVRWTARDAIDPTHRLAATAEPPAAVIRAARAALEPGEPLLLLTAAGTRDARFARGAGASFVYVVCPRNGEHWRGVLRAALRHGPRLFLLHRGRAALRPGPAWRAPPLVTRCGRVSVESLRWAARAAGWRPLRSGAGWRLYGR